MMAFMIPLILLAVILIYKKTATLHERIFPALYRRTEFMESRYPPKDKMDFRKNSGSVHAHQKLPFLKDVGS